MSARKAEREDRLCQIGDYWLSKTDKSPNWCRTWFDKEARQTRRKSLLTDDLAEAQQALANFVAATPTYDRKDPSQVTVHAILIWYYESHAKDLVIGSATKCAISLWGEFFPNTTTVDELIPPKIDAFVKTMRKSGLSLGYIRSIIRTGITAFNRAKKHHLISHAPYITDGINPHELKSQSQPQGRPLTVNEMARLHLAAQTGDRLQRHVYAFLMIMTHTMCRPAAAMDLTKSQIDFEYGLVHLNPPKRIQTKKRRPIVPMTPTFKTFLVEWESSCTATAKDEAIVNPEFTNYVAFKGKSVSDITSAWHSLVERAGLKPKEKDAMVGPYVDHITPYSIRHTMARALRAARVSPEDLSVFLGHMPEGGGSNMTLLYAPYEPDFLKDAVAAIV